MKSKNYLVTVAHDRGMYRRFIISTSKKKIINILCRQESCPKRAIKDIELLPEYPQVTRINSDKNGNPRYVIHYLSLSHLLNDDNVYNSYEQSLKIAKKRIGGKKYNNKKYGGGIVFQSYNLYHDLAILMSRKD